MKLTAAVLMGALALPAVGQEMTAQQRVQFNAQIEAVLNVRQCRSDGGVQCQWRGLNYQLGDGFSGTIQVPDGPSWSFSCRHDRVEGNNVCTLMQNGFRLVSIDGNEWVSWGGQTYPGSDRVARLGQGAPIRWPEDAIIDGGDAASIVEIMSLTPTSLFRWFDWPDNVPRDIETDNRRMDDAVNLFRAIQRVQREQQGLE